MITLYELSIHFPDSIEIIEHKSNNEFSPFFGGEFCKLNACISQNGIIREMGILTGNVGNFDIGIRGYFSFDDALFYDTRDDLNNFDFKDEVHFYTFKKQNCQKALKTFYELIGEQKDRIDKMMKNISEFRKKV